MDLTSPEARTKHNIVTYHVHKECCPYKNTVLFHAIYFVGQSNKSIKDFRLEEISPGMTVVNVTNHRKKTMQPCYSLHLSICLPFTFAFA